MNLPNLDAPFPPYLLDRFGSWRSRRFQPDRIWYGKLAEMGQHPRTMIVSCCDSRVDTVQMFGAEPGDLFVVRNVANLVPPFEPDHHHHGTSAAVEYAVLGLGVAHIVVVGHSNCGGVEACDGMCSGRSEDLEGGSGFVGRWMDILRAGWDRVEARHPDPLLRRRMLEQEAVRISLENLRTFPCVEQRLRADLLSLHGGWVDIASGRLHVLDPATDEFRPGA